MNQGVGRHTTIIVGGLIGVAIIWLTFSIFPWRIAAVLSALLLYEAWTLINAYPEDTLSESLWRLSAWPIVPWMFGLATGWLVTTGIVANPWALLALGFTQGHFWWQAHYKAEERQEERVETAAATGVAPIG